MADITGGVPKKVGGYGASTSTSENKLFNRGVEITSPKPSQVGGYEASAKGNAARMYRMTGNSPASTAPVQYGTALNTKLKKARINRALGVK